MTKNLTTDQQIFISNLEKKIVPEIFLSPNNSNKIVFDDREIKSTAIKLFGVADAYSLLVMISESKNIRETDAVAVGLSCGCSTSNDWCTGESTCHPGGCNSKSGCGTLFLYTCNGDCKVDVIMYN